MNTKNFLFKLTGAGLAILFLFQIQQLNGFVSYITAAVTIAGAILAWRYKT